jgi:hypothetical protein
LEAINLGDEIRKDETINLGDEIRKDETGTAFGTYGERREILKGFGGEI